MDLRGGNDSLLAAGRVFMRVSREAGGGMNIPTQYELARALLPAAVRAARLELSYFRSNFEVERKADASPVTVADQEAEVIILEALAEIAPGVSVIAEEQFSAGIAPPVDGTLFLVDALDGTRAFVRGKAEFTINVALIVDHVPVFGLIMVPFDGEIYVTTGADQVRFATIDVAAESEFDDIGWIPVHTRAPDPKALVVAISNAHPSSRLEQQLSGKPIAGRIEAGSSIKFCRVAEGRADLYPRLGSISEWDIAAGHAILRAAGGEVTQLGGEQLAYGNHKAKFRTPPFVAWGREALKEHVRFRRD
jgi:3'(2'), 5'-bisphosphate nucleotidase